MLPFSPKENKDNAEREGTLTAAEKLILTRMKQEAIKPKMNINFGMILVVLAIIVGGYFALDYFKII